MKYNKEYNNDEIICVNKTKVLFIGFIVGIIPFLIVLGLISIKEGGFEYMPSIFRNTLIIAAIITALINAVVLKNMYVDKMETSSIMD